MTNLYITERIGDLISSIIVVYFFYRVMPPRYKKYNKVYSIIMIIFYTMVSLNRINSMIPNLQTNKIFLFIFNYCILALIYPLLFRRGRMSEKFFLTAFYISIMLLSSFIVYSIFSKIFNVKLVDIFFKVSYERSIAMLSTRFIQFILIFILLNSSNNIGFIKYIKDKTLYIVGVILTLNHILILVIERTLLNDLIKINIEVITIVLSLCNIEILLIYMLNILSKEIEEKFTLKINLDQKMHDEEIKYIYKEMNGWKHDFRNHISMILGLLEVSTKEDVVSYINEIDNSITTLHKNVYIDNVGINSILISKMKIANEKDIKVNLDFKINSDIKMSNVDICIILGNLLDNSIEACNFIEGYKFIDLKIVSENSRLVIKISNSTNGYVNEVNGKFLTTKKNSMNGIGLIQVDNIVKKYKGYINRKHENKIFTTYMMIQY